MTTKPATHTPGPWRVALDGSVIKAGKSRSVAGTYGGNHKEDQEAFANARLIAAAPDMLEALEMARSDIHSDCPAMIDIPDCVNLCVTITAIIAKAKGEAR